LLPAALEEAEEATEVDLDSVEAAVEVGVAEPGREASSDDAEALVILKCVSRTAWDVPARGWVVELIWLDHNLSSRAKVRRCWILRLHTHP
jgi:hypothetical protein